MGIQTANIFTAKDFKIPSAWIFEKLLNLPKLEGQTEIVRSVFGNRDSNPSLKIYMSENGKYRFNDFSHGRKGDAIDFVQIAFNLSGPQEAMEYIQKLWKDSGSPDLKIKTKEKTIRIY